MSFLSTMAGAVGKVINWLLDAPDKVVSFGVKVAKTVTPTRIVKAGKLAVSASVFYTVIIKKTIPFFYNLWKGTRKKNRPFVADILASRGNDPYSKEAKENIDKMTSNAVKVLREDNAGIKMTGEDFFGRATTEEDKFKSFDREDRILLNEIKNRSSKESNMTSEEVEKEAFFQNASEYLDQAMGRTPKVELPEIQNEYFRDYLRCTGGHRRPLRYTFKEDYLTVGDHIYTPATIADAYMDSMEKTLAWMRSNRSNPTNATQNEYMFYNEILPAVAQNGFRFIKMKAKEKPLSMGEFKAALKWVIQESSNFRPENPMKYYTPNRSR